MLLEDLSPLFEDERVIDDLRTSAYESFRGCAREGDVVEEVCFDCWGEDGTLCVDLDWRGEFGMEGLTTNTGDGMCECLARGEETDL